MSIQFVYLVTGPFFCSTCEHKWGASHPAGQVVRCPSCNNMNGRSTVPVDKEKDEAALRCKCMDTNSFMVLMTQDDGYAILCRRCGYRFRIGINITPLEDIQKQMEGNQNVVKPE